MDNTIFLLSTNENNEAIIRNAINSDYTIYSGTKNNLMAELYKINPKLLIVDIDGFEDHTIAMIQSILSIEYLPVIYVYSENSNIIELIKDETLVSIGQLQDSLLPLIKQASIFRGRYANVMESYDAIDLLNGEVKSSLKKYINMEYSNISVLIKELLNLVFAQNLFLTNKPDILWVMFSNKVGYASTMFQLTADLYEEKISIDIDKEDSFNFDIYAVNGFSKNFNTNEISDINFSRKIFPKALRCNTPDIINFTGFSIGDLTLMGMNYKNAVTNYDIAIIKALAINFDLIDTIKYQMNELEEAFEYTTNALARAAEANDDVTGKHIKRVNSFAKLIAKELGMNKEFIQKIYNAAQMHDVGKIYVDKNIISKPGKLTETEFQEIKQHTIYGEKIIGDSEYLKMSAEIARNHHEKYDGTGYPDAKIGDEIPFSARIVFLADIYDALRSERPYKPGFSHEKAYDIITVGDGRVNPEHFDPKVLEVFKKVHLDFDKIYEKLKD